MALASVDIVNSALAKIGEDPITSLDDDRHAARVARTQYPLHRDKLLRLYNWRFAMRRATLAPLATAPEFGFAYRFNLPTDCLRVVGVYTEDDPNRFQAYTTGSLAFKVEGRELLLNEDTAKIYYIAQVTDPGQFDSMFVEALAWSLTVDFALSIANSPSRADQARGELREMIRVARLASAIENSPEVITGGTWLPIDDPSSAYGLLPPGALG